MLQLSYWNRFINGSMIAFIAIPSPAMETKNAVMFSIKALTFEVVGWTELKRIPLTCLNTFLIKLNISINLATM